MESGRDREDRSDLSCCEPQVAVRSSSGRKDERENDEQAGDGQAQHTDVVTVDDSSIRGRLLVGDHGRREGRDVSDDRLLLRRGAGADGQCQRQEE